MPKLKKKIILLGAGGHCRVIIDAIKNSKEYEIYGILDPKFSEDVSVSGVKIVGKDELLFKLFKEGVKTAFICVGSTLNCEPRKRIYAQLKNIGFQLPVLVHPKAIVAYDVRIEEGTFVAPGAVIGPNVKIGKNAIINTSSSVNHDCIIGDFVHIAPGATLCGGVKVGDETFIGAGANIIQFLNIGKKCVIGAGATVRRDVRKGMSKTILYNNKNVRVHEKGSYYS